MKITRFILQYQTLLILQIAVYFVAVTTPPVKAQTCAPAPVGLVSWYSGDNNALDARSRNNATLQNGATFVANGKVAQAISFDGVDDYAEIPDAASLKPTNVSIETWVKFDSLDSATTSIPGLQYLVFKKNSRAVFFEGYALVKLRDNGNDVFQFGGTSAAGVQGIASGTPVGNSTLNAGEFYHVVGTYDGSAIKLYINGQLVAQTPASFPLDYDTRPVFLGTSGESFDGRLSGVLDETAIYNRALTAGEVQAIYAAGSTGKCKPTATVLPSGALIWLGGDGDTLDSSFRYAAVDASGNNNNSKGFRDGTSISPSGQVGASIALSGTNSSVDIPASASLNVGTSDGMTMELWINPDDVVRLQALVEWNSPVSQQGSHLWIYNPDSYNGDGVLYGNLIDTSGNEHYIYTGVNQIVANTFQHVAFTYDKTTGTAVLYRNGVALTTQNIGIFTPQTTFDLYLGSSPPYQPANFAGKMDEVGIHSRSLSAAEIQSLYNAGAAGQPKSQATGVSLTNLAAWYEGEQFQQPNNGYAALYNGAGYGVGKVRQAFSFDGVDDLVDLGRLTPGANYTVEAWFNPASVQSGRRGILGGFDQCRDWGITLQGGQIAATFRPFGGNCAADVYSGIYVTPGQWYHAVATNDGTTIRLYVDGVELNSALVAPGYIGTDSGTWVGAERCCGGFFHGLIDEPTIYNRVLSSGEIQSIYNAGIAGKLKTTTTTVGANSSTTTGDATLNLPNVTAAGTSQETALDPAGLPALPMGFNLLTASAIDVTTTATYTGAPTVCFNLPALSSGQIGTANILHLENGGWVSRTLSRDANNKQICAGNLSALGVFAIVTGAPTSALVTIGGRVLSNSGNNRSGGKGMKSFGRGIARARVTLTDPSGNLRTTFTNSFGYYRFAEVVTGATYVIEVRNKRYSFAAQVFYISEESTDYDFIALF